MTQALEPGVMAIREDGVRGTQSVRRALGLLRLVAQQSGGGVKLVQLVRASGLDRATAYRLLTCLQEEGFVDRDDAQRYRLGLSAVTLGSLMPEPTPLVSRFGPIMKRIARITGDTVYLFVRKGDYVHCEHREVGGSLVKILTTDVGQRRLLGTGTAGVAVLGLMSEADIAQLWRRRSQEYVGRGMTREQLFAVSQAVHANGYVINFDAVEPGVAGLGMSFRMGAHAMGALSMSSLTATFGPDRQYQFRHLLATELEGLGSRNPGDG